MTLIPDSCAGTCDLATSTIGAPGSGNGKPCTCKPTPLPTRIDGPWRTRPIVGGLYRRRDRPATRVLVLGGVQEDEKVAVEYQRTKRRGRVKAADLIDETKWHLMGLTQVGMVE